MIEYTSGPRAGRKIFNLTTINIFSVTEGAGLETVWATVWPARWTMPREFLVGNKVLDKCDFKCVIDATTSVLRLWNDYRAKITPQLETLRIVYAANYICAGKKVKVKRHSYIEGTVSQTEADYISVKIPGQKKDGVYARTDLEVVNPENYLVGVLQCARCLNTGRAYQLKAKIVDGNILMCGSCAAPRPYPHYPVHNYEDDYPPNYPPD
jgi:hypothetical protein